MLNGTGISFENGIVDLSGLLNKTGITFVNGTMDLSNLLNNVSIDLSDLLKPIGLDNNISIDLSSLFNGTIVDLPGLLNGAGVTYNEGIIDFSSLLNGTGINFINATSIDLSGLFNETGFSLVNGTLDLSKIMNGLTIDLPKLLNVTRVRFIGSTIDLSELLNGTEISFNGTSIDLSKILDKIGIKDYETMNLTRLLDIFGLSDEFELSDFLTVIGLNTLNIDLSNLLNSTKIIIPNFLNGITINITSFKELGISFINDTMIDLNGFLNKTGINLVNESIIDLNGFNVTAIGLINGTAIYLTEFANNFKNFTALFENITSKLNNIVDTLESDLSNLYENITFKIADFTNNLNLNLSTLLNYIDADSPLLKYINVDIVGLLKDTKIDLPTLIKYANMDLPTLLNNLDIDLPTLLNHTSIDLPELLNDTEFVVFDLIKNGFDFNSLIKQANSSISNFINNMIEKAIGNQTDPVKQYSIVASDLTKYYTKSTMFKVTVKYGDELVTEGDVILTINNKKYVGSIGSNGVSAVNLKSLKPGKYNVSINYGPVTVKKTITVKKAVITKNMSKKYKKAGKFTVKVLNSKGKAFAKQTVKIKFNGKTYKIKTNKNGIATFKLSKKLKVGKYTIKTTYEGLTLSNKVTVTR